LGGRPLGFDLLPKRLVVECVPNLLGVDAHSFGEVGQHVLVTDISARLPERLEDGDIEIEPRLVGVVFGDVVGGNLGVKRVDVGREFECHVDVVFFLQAADGLFGLCVVVVVLAVVDRVVDGSIGVALAAPEIERLPVDC
jgi:hypothetical protein